jgi:hypothetical protein
MITYSQQEIEDTTGLCTGIRDASQDFLKALQSGTIDEAIREAKRLSAGAALIVELLKSIKRMG